MNTKHTLLCISLILLNMHHLHAQTASMEAFAKGTPTKEAFQPLPFGAIKPAGWLREQMQRDVDGFVGNLDKLVPDLITNDDMYGAKRLTKKVKSKSVGNISEGAEWEVQYLWWNSETQSNWLDGYVRNVLLLNNPANAKQNEKHRKKIQTIIKHILATQDTDGYIGIYAPDLRYKFTDENGELWSKATLYRALLAYYEATGDEKVIKAVVRAVENVMSNYPINASTPFKAAKPYAGICHGLAFTDVLDKLHQITHNGTYWDYALFLYQDYSRHELSEKDVQFANVVNPAYKLAGHGAHTFEHIRSLMVARFAAGNPQLEQALQTYLQRIEQATTPTGGAIGDEWIAERTADGTHTGYEYCSLHEVMDAHAQLFQKTGTVRFADNAEKVFLNAAQGARHPEKSCIAYLKTDNSYEMLGTRNGEVEADKKQTRYKYSPVHQDVAVCCVPNAGRITPYYVQNMWLKNENSGENSLVAALFGACEMQTTLNGANIHISEQTNFPYDYTIRFDITTDRAAQFAFHIRKPAWAASYKVQIAQNQAHSEKDGLITIEKTWRGKETVTVEFVPTAQTQRVGDEAYFSYGPLVLALPIEAEEIQTKTYSTKPFADVGYRRKAKTVYEYKQGAIEKVVGSEMKFTVPLFNPTTQRTENLMLIPVGKTILRQVTFKQ
jgi:uncharacterized protein